MGSRHLIFQGKKKKTIKNDFLKENHLNKLESGKDSNNSLRNVLGTLENPLTRSSPMNFRSLTNFVKTNKLKKILFLFVIIIF